jgi:hypothetical protein
MWVAYDGHVLVQQLEMQGCVLVEPGDVCVVVVVHASAQAVVAHASAQVVVVVVEVDMLLQLSPYV